MTLVKYCDGTYTTYVILTKTLVLGAFYGPLAIVLTFFHCQKKSNRTKIMVFRYHLKSAAEIYSILQFQRRRVNHIYLIYSCIT